MTEQFNIKFGKYDVDVLYNRYKRFTKTIYEIILMVADGRYNLSCFDENNSTLFLFDPQIQFELGFGFEREDQLVSLCYCGASVDVENSFKFFLGMIMVPYWPLMHPLLGSNPKKSSTSGPVRSRSG
ncbi:hypothetical protein MtrunA17_Chr7g0219771 [Medicago truncatula]|uniref:Uncharacterized protein n=1 Tax=Medicago truncatula TaxID=3880 RepID=A0A072TXW6_MEDTR|nr:hypothetical protein MTR_7g015650 [Medicago truncatula]RHN44468.1 hypothetical protein MtrunA17_Chr7g0219771 [Medicago truncatula]